MKKLPPADLARSLRLNAGSLLDAVPIHRQIGPLNRKFGETCGQRQVIELMAAALGKGIYVMNFQVKPRGTSQAILSDKTATSHAVSSETRTSFKQLKASRPHPRLPTKLIGNKFSR